MKLERLKISLDGAVVIPKKKEELAFVEIQPGKEWIELHRSLQLRDRFLVSAVQSQAQSVMMRDVGKVRIEFHAFAKSALGGGPIAFVIHVNGRERIVGFGQSVIQF